MNLTRRAVWTLVVSSVFVSQVMTADISNVISYQGRLTNPGGSPIANQTVSVEFRIYNAPTGGTEYWMEAHSVSTDANGIFYLQLGSISPMPDSLFSESQRWLGIRVLPDPEIAPRTRFGSVPYSYEFSEYGPDSISAFTGTAFKGIAFGNSTGTLLESMVGISGQSQNNSTGEAYAGYFRTNAGGSGNRYGIKSECFGSATSFTCGVSSTYGLYSYAENSSTNCTYGVYGEAKSGAIGTAIGGHFEAPSFGTGPHLGVRGIAEGDASGFGQIGVIGSATNTSGESVGVQGNASSTSSGTAYGGYFVGEPVGTGIHYGVYAIEAAGGSGAAVYASGDQIASGTKSAILKTTLGEVLFYALESPEVWFEDVGESQLLNGRARIELNATFLETVSISDSNPMKVFIQLNDENCYGTAVKRSLTGFEVIEFQQGKSNASFTYRVMAKRKGYEKTRHPLTNAGKQDPNLYPEQWSKISEKNAISLSSSETNSEK